MPSASPRRWARTTLWSATTAATAISSAHVDDMAGLMAEIMGRAGGICGGWGGSQHLCVPGRFYSNGIQGGIMPFALGLALAQRLGGTDHAVAIFIGDGTLGQGAVYESLNMAACFGAPLLIIVEDNGIAQTTPTEATTAGTVPARAAAFGLECIALEYPGPEAVEDAARTLLKTVRTGQTRCPRAPFGPPRPAQQGRRHAAGGGPAKIARGGPSACRRRTTAGQQLPSDGPTGRRRRRAGRPHGRGPTTRRRLSRLGKPQDTRPDTAGTPHADCPRSAAQLETLARRSFARSGERCVGR